MGAGQDIQIDGLSQRGADGIEDVDPQVLRVSHTPEYFGEFQWQQNGPHSRPARLVADPLEDAVPD